MTEDPKRGRWYIGKYRKCKTNPHTAHLMSDDETAFCGHHIKYATPAGVYGEWNPEDHLNIACPQCLQWWRDLKPCKVIPARIGSDVTT